MTIEDIGPAPRGASLRHGVIFAALCAGAALAGYAAGVQLFWLVIS